MNKVKKWLVGAQRRDSDIEEQVTATSPTEAFLRFTRRRRIWLKGAYMEVVKGDFLSAVGRGGAPKLVLATGNGVLRRDGTLVMGAGSAKALAEAYPQTPKLFGEMVRKGVCPKGKGWYLYGVLAVQVGPSLSIGLFQTKGDWREPASLALVAHSARKLAEWLKGNPGWEAHVAFPGVGLGGLEEREVLEVLRERLSGLPVVLYRL